MYHPSKTGLTPLRELRNSHDMARVAMRDDQTNLMGYPFVAGGFIGPVAKDVDIPADQVKEQRMSGPLAAVWGLINGLS